jgi:hypothetical protein
MNGDAPTQEGSVSDKAAVVAAKLAARKTAAKEKEREQTAFILECTFDDVIVDENNPKALKGPGSNFTALQTIKGACINLLSSNMLRQFCINNKIEGYRGKTKLQFCAMICERKRHGNLDEVMYPNDFDDEEEKDEEEKDDNGDDDAQEGGGAKKKKKLAKGTKPREILGDGSLYRVILVYFLQSLRHYVLRLGLNPSAVQLGTSSFLHEDVYNQLANVYNDATNESLKSFKLDNEIYISAGVKTDAPATFEQLPALAFCQAMNFINKHYRALVRRRLSSGNHKPFDQYCRDRPYLLLYYNNIVECGSSVLGTLACPTLPACVKRSSLLDRDGKDNPSTAPPDKKRESAADKLVEVSNVCSHIMLCPGSMY